MLELLINKLVVFLVIHEFSVEVSLCFPLAKNPSINYYLIKVLLDVLLKHQEGLENEKSESTLTIVKHKYLKQLWKRTSDRKDQAERKQFETF